MNSRFNNQPQQKQHRKELRTSMSECERILWVHIRKRALGVKFRRQHSIGNYILDFYCAEKKLAIELDGGQHWEARDYDEVRTKYLNALGIEVLRVWNNEVRENLHGVLYLIEEKLRGR